MVTEQLHRIDSAGAYFVVREKHKMRYEVIVDKNYNNPETGIMADQVILFTGNKTQDKYPEDMLSYFTILTATEHSSFIATTLSCSQK